MYVYWFGVVLCFVVLGPLHSRMRKESYRSNQMLERSYRGLEMQTAELEKARHNMYPTGTEKTIQSPEKTVQSPEKIIQRPKIFDKTLNKAWETQKQLTRTKNIKQE